MKVAVVGGGAAGIAATADLLRDGAQVTLFDANPDLGGRCRSHLWNGQWLIRGAAAFVAGEEIVVDAARSLGIYNPAAIMESEEELEFTVVHPAKGYVPLGKFRAADIASSSLLTLREKARIGAAMAKLFARMSALDERDPTGAIAHDDISACAYFEQRSQAFADYMLEPIMAQYFGYDRDDFSLAWLLWVLGSRRAVSGAPWTFKERGTGALTASFEERFRANPRCTVRTHSAVEKISCSGSDATVRYEGADERFDAVICAVPGSLVNTMIDQLPEAHAAFFSEVGYVAHHIFHMIVDAPKGEVPFSLLYPTVDGYEVVSNTWVKPWDEGRVLLYGEVKGAWAATHRQLSDTEILGAAVAEIARGIPAFAGTVPHDAHLQRNDIALCSRRPGYTRALADFRSLPPVPRIRFAGDYLINSTVGQAMRSGQTAAAELLDELRR